MPRYAILITKQQAITYEIEAENKESAQQLVLTHGEEIDCETIDYTICKIDEIKEEE